MSYEFGLVVEWLRGLVADRVTFYVKASKKATTCHVLREVP